jgi:RHS repeat-associated protein
VVALSDTSGTITDTYEYDPFGKLLAHNGTTVNSYQFVGGYGVREIGESRSIMGVRLYDAELGRFLQEDPIWYLSGEINFHRYGKNNSLFFTDPYGLYSFAEFVNDVANFAAGFGDTITFGGTAWIREHIAEEPDIVNKESGCYTGVKKRVRHNK